MRKLIIIPLAALGILVGLGLVAESRSGETATPTATATPTYHFAHCWNEQGEVLDCDEAFP